MKRILSILFIAGSGVLAYSQNLNPTVSITNTYKSAQEEWDKQYVGVALPDSLTRFDYHFDYSVFDTPYKGAFEFSPYTVKLSPEDKKADYGTFFLRAGAGYDLHPQLQAVWSPLKSNSFNLDVHQDFHGYYGKYRTVRKRLDDYPMWTTTGDRYSGYDFSELFGTDGIYSGKKFDTRFGIDYNGIFTSDEYAVNAFHSVIAGIGLKPDKRNRQKMYFDASLSFDFASDALSHPFGDRKLDQGAFDLKATLGPKFTDAFGILVDARLLSVNYRGADKAAYSYFGFALSPHIELSLGPVGLAAGVKVDGTSHIRIAPDIRASMKLVNDRLKLSASVTGGTKFNTYSEFRRRWHWFCPALSETITNGWEKINFKIGLEGSAFGHLQYNVSGGWASEGDMALWGVRNLSGTLSPLLSFRDCNYSYIDVSAIWKSSRLDIDGAFRYRKSNLDGSADVFDMPVASGDLRAAYNWNRRVFAGVRMNASSRRDGAVAGIPLHLAGYVDLGVFGEFRFNSKWSVWVEGGNLLNQTVQIVPMHAENGISGTAGVSLRL